MDIFFHIPDFTNHLYLNTILINSISKYPEYFHDGLKIASVFGNFPSSVWNGGRYLGGSANMEAVKSIAEAINSKGIPLRFTFTNPMLEEKHLGDSYCNMVLRVCNNGLNEVIVMSPLLEKYIRENYPEYPITSSTCKQIRDIGGVKEELEKDYKYVVLDYNFNNKFDQLEQIDEKDRHRCEILVNACCTPNCPRRGEHYRQIGRDHIAAWEHSKDLLSKKPFEPAPFECEFMNNGPYESMKLSTHVSPQAIFEEYLPRGFNSFKIEGRTVADIDLLEYYVYYMVKPEYQNETRLRLLSVLTERHKYFVPAQAQANTK